MKLKPQVLTAILVLGMVDIYALYLGMMEIATAATTGIAALGMKLVDEKGGIQ